MNISQWPISKIMQLPDHCFGRRHLVSVTKLHIGASAGWDISELALPEIMVIWELILSSDGGENGLVLMRLALGDQLPTSVAQMTALEPLFNGFGLQGLGPRTIRFTGRRDYTIRNLRMPVRTSGRRLVLENIPPPAETYMCSAGIVISSIPKEIPDCLLYQ